MNASRWIVPLGTRLSRRGLGAGGAAALAAWTDAAHGRARKKKKKKKKPSGICTELGQDCPGGGCCAGLECKPIFNSGPADPRCCRSGGECRFAADCCRGTYCGGGECLVCKGDGEACAAGQCCPGFFCFVLIPTEPGECMASD